MIPAPAVLLSLALSTSAAPVRVAPAEAQPLAGCQAKHAGVDTWEYECEGFRARSADRAERIETAAFLDGVAGGVRSAVGDDATVARGRELLGGREADVVRITRGGAEIVTAVLPSPEGARILRCVAPAQRCGPVLETLAALPWRTIAPGAVAGKDSELELRLGGRRVAVPSGCTGRPENTGGQITCGEQQFIVFWNEVADEQTASRAAASLGAELAARFASCPACRVSSDRVPCRIAGVEASCERLVATIPVDRERPEGERARFLSLRGWAPVAGRPTFAACTALGAEPAPPPCAVLFELR